MYKHVLIPTDGSPLAEKAVKAGIEFARQVGARVTAFIAMPEYQMPSETDFVAHRHVLSPSEYTEQVGREAQEILGKIAQRAAAEGVVCGRDYALCDRPSEAIIDAAKRLDCDLIFMASHGRRGLSAVLHGSETRAVLTHSTIPTLVYR